MSRTCRTLTLWPRPTPWRGPARAGASGFGIVGALVTLVVLAAIAAAVVRLGWGSQMAAAHDLQGARAEQAAIAGTEWGLYQALKGSWGTCGTGSQNLDLRSTLGFMVTVTCSYTSYNEGESSPGVARVVRVYTLDAVACTSAAGCPDNTAAVGRTYVERRRQVLATDRAADE